VPARKFENTADMILMFMRDQDCGDIRRRQLQALQAPLSLAQTETAVQHHGGSGSAGGGGNQ
jgi:hypothetical protein